jgi:hypothetical protein
MWTPPRRERPGGGVTTGRVELHPFDNDGVAPAGSGHERRHRRSSPLRRLRRRQFFHRLGLALLGLVLIALASAGLVWLMDSFQNYNPKYYEPKDIERERYEMQRRAQEESGTPKAK